VSGSVVVNLRLPAEMAEATKARAEQEARTTSSVIRHALKLHLAEPDHVERRTA
jgi:predicted DNA-binding protein